MGNSPDGHNWSHRLAGLGFVPSCGSSCYKGEQERPQLRFLKWPFEQQPHIPSFLCRFILSRFFPTRHSNRHSRSSPS
ncbi:uncharacterized protein EI97DRAFT_59663 [Westerdykella ornata]|uniref:Uncharacterized protein n=1 Tax=Westerdykella ornata TaxID=318751 RepID=A0A6A6JHK6_WESOR|nr:uncharacterized protein EI97DRAFT_59663 [Westerdykella ornata]KAF2275892.1 hypothetical protein EI97DRAFT_59663 [Westerdykella ornata]